MGQTITTRHGRYNKHGSSSIPCNRVLYPITMSLAFGVSAEDSHKPTAPHHPRSGQLKFHWPNYLRMPLKLNPEYISTPKLCTPFGVHGVATVAGGLSSGPVLPTAAGLDRIMVSAAGDLHFGGPQ